MKVNTVNMHVYLRCHGNKVVVARIFCQQPDAVSI